MGKIDRSNCFINALTLFLTEFNYKLAELIKTYGKLIFKSIGYRQ